ncbi:MAG: NAD(P)-dependent alcohol dehydrogenase, partial [Acidimicrobiales bacterium]
TQAVDLANCDPVTRVAEIGGDPTDVALECTGASPVVCQAAGSIGMLGTCILVGGAPAGAELSLDHPSTQWGRRVAGVMGG